MNGSDPNWQPRRVLVGYDGGEGGRDAVALAAALAEPDGEFLLVDVIPPAGNIGVRPRRLGVEAPSRSTGFFAQALEDLAGRTVETRDCFADTAPHGLTEIAVDEGFDLIVLGSSHRGTIARILDGSVGEALLQDSPVPVVTAPRGYADSPHSVPATVAVAYDGGGESRHALAYAQAIVAESGGTLDILTVERPVDPVGGAIAYTMSLPEDADEIQREALQEVDPKIKLRRRVLNGETAAALADACTHGVDLLVVGSRGHGTIERVLLGSTSSALIEKAPCPVLVVPRPAELGSRPARAGDVESPRGPKPPVTV